MKYNRKLSVLFSLLKTAVNSSQTNGNEIGQDTGKRTLTGGRVHGLDERLHRLQTVVLRAQRHQVVLNEQAHAWIASEVAVVLEYALNDGREHLDDDVRTRRVAAVSTKEVADLRRRVVLFEKRTKAHDDLFVCCLWQVVLMLLQEL